MQEICDFSNMSADTAALERLDKIKEKVYGKIDLDKAACILFPNLSCKNTSSKGGENDKNKSK